ncbi:MAG: TIGR00730 family Rossman fold protein, partial [Steroidobacteraceae bacterium]|nr:TIGR00730 family Rossman fold protein [Steroidobacteraceae bacterium]
MPLRVVSLPAMRVCVFCGSSLGSGARPIAAARRLGELLAMQRHELVYGGGSVGLMGVLADAALAAGGRVIGILPAKLRRRELAHAGLSELRITADMAARKTEMLNTADAFITLPGGIGTLDELFEVWTLAQIGEHRKPVLLINLDGYYDKLLAFLRDAVAAGFLADAVFEL